MRQYLRGAAKRSNKTIGAPPYDTVTTTLYTEALDIHYRSTAK